MDSQIITFLDSPVFPESMSCSPFATVIPEYKTSSVTMNNGSEMRNRVYVNHIKKMTINGAMRTIDWEEKQIDEFSVTDFTNFYHAVGGDFAGFRVKVPTDYICSVSTGYLENGFGNGKPTYQLAKKYARGAGYTLKPIKKPNPEASFKVVRNGVDCVVGTNAGQIQIDFNTGLITFKADKQLNITNISVGVDCVVTTSQLHGLTTGSYVYLSGLGANTLNEKAYQITVITNVSFKLVGVTNSAIAGTGFASVYPQPNEPLRWSGEFHHPMRFDGDMIPHFDADGLIQFETINLKELK